MSFAELIALIQKGRLRHAGTQMLVGAVALLLAGVMLLGVNVSTMRRNFEWVQQADDVLLQISAVETGATGDELSVRGYALTDDPRFLRYQRDNRANVAASMAKLGMLVADEPPQKARFVQLEQIIATHGDIFGALTRLGPGHAKDVASAIVDNSNRAVMDDMRQQLVAFRGEELSLLKQRQAAASAQAARTYDIAVGIVVAAFLLGALGIALAQFGKNEA